MKKNISLLSFIFLLTVFSQVTFAQDSKTENGLPKAKDTIRELGNFLGSPIEKYSDAYFVLDELNPSLGPPPAKFNFQTPQATLEHFFKSCRNDNFKDAAYALNLNLFPKNISLDEAAILAEKFYFVLDKKLAVNWDDLPDRPDGQIDITTKTNSSVAGKPRRSIQFGSLSMKDKDAILRLQRVKIDSGEVFWIISANTVENIETLYKLYGPGKLDLLMPKWTRINILGVPWWKILGTIILLVLAIIIGRISKSIVTKIFKKSDKKWMRMVANRLSTPTGLFTGTLFFYLLLESLISFGGPFARWLYTILLIVLVTSIGWLIMRFINTLMTFYAQETVGDDPLSNNPEAKRMMTYISVLRRLVTLVIILVGLSIIFSQFDSLSKLGISLMASAGLVSIVLGVAAQDTLGNILAGIQIALTKPAKIGDTVMIDDELGVVEDITFTFVVIRTWDQKRLVVPCKELVSKIFVNWSMTNEHIVKPIIMYVDYKTDVEVIRQKFKELLENSEEWDEENEPNVEVVEITEKSLKIRALCSAKNPGVAWKLHCDLREQLMSFIAKLDDGKRLVRLREEENNTLK